MGHIRHYRVLPWATGPLTLLESVTKVPDRQVAETGKSSIFWLLSVFLSASLSHASMITVEAITTIQTRKKQHKSLSTVLTVYRSHSTRTILQWFSSTPMLTLSAIHHFVRTLFIACAPPPPPPPPIGSSTEHVLTYSLATLKDEDGNCQGQLVHVV